MTRIPMSLLDRVFGPVTAVACAAVLFRIASSIMALIANTVLPLYRPSTFGVFAQPSPFWDAFVRYDSGWYLTIARSGYDTATALAGGRSNIAFFPVYPLLMRYVGRSFGPAPSDLYLGGILIAWVSFVLAMIVLYRLASLDLPRERALLAILLAMIFPFAFFYGVVYSESTFLLFTLMAFYFFRTRR